VNFNSTSLCSTVWNIKLGATVSTFTFISIRDWSSVTRVHISNVRFVEIWRYAYRRYGGDDTRSAWQVSATTTGRREIRDEMSSTEQQRDDVVDWFQRLTNVIARTTWCSQMARFVFQQTAKHRSRLYCTRCLNC